MAARFPVNDSHPPSESTTASPSPAPKRSRRNLLLATVLLGITAGILVIVFVHRAPAPHKSIIPYFTVPIGKVREPLPFRIISFHHADRANRDLILLASQL